MKRIGSGRCRVVAHHHDVAGCGLAVKFTPAEKSGVHCAVAGHRGAHGWSVLAGSFSRFNGNRFVSRAAVQGYVDRSGAAVCLIEIIYANVDAVAAGDAERANEWLVHIAARGLHVHRSAQRYVVGFGFIERDRRGTGQRTRVQVAARMILAGGHGVGNVASHALNGRDRVEHPRFSAILRNVEWRVASHRKGIGRECRCDHHLWILVLDCQERLAILIAFAAQAGGNQINDFYGRRIGGLPPGQESRRYCQENRG